MRFGFWIAKNLCVGKDRNIISADYQALPMCKSFAGGELQWQMTQKRDVLTTIAAESGETVRRLMSKLKFHHI